MTPRQLKKASTRQLIVAYKDKARCFHSEGKAKSIYDEMERRLGVEVLRSLRLGTWHMQHGEGDGEFNEECDKLIKLMEI